MKRVTFFIFCIAFMAISIGCAGRQTEAALKNMDGGHINMAIAEFGPPSDVVRISDEEAVYVWTRSNSGTAFISEYKPTSQTHMGSIYSSGRPVGSYSGYSSGGETVVTPYQYNMFCEIKVMTNGGRITSWSWRGNACE